jgi:hypothetical protein
MRYGGESMSVGVRQGWGFGEAKARCVEAECSGEVGSGAVARSRAVRSVGESGEERSGDGEPGSTRRVWSRIRRCVDVTIVGEVRGRSSYVDTTK